MKVLWFALALILGTVSYVEAATVNLLWTDASSNEAGFRVYRQLNGAAFSVAGEVGENVATFQQDLPLDDNMHCYQVTAFNVVGESPPSNTACIVMHSTAPSAPTTLTVTVTVIIQ